MKNEINDTRLKNLQKEINTLKIDIDNLKEMTRIFQKKMEMTQDEVIRMAVEKQSLIMSVTYIMNVATELATREGITVPDPQSGIDKPGVPSTKNRPSYMT